MNKLREYAKTHQPVTIRSRFNEKYLSVVQRARNGQQEWNIEAYKNKPDVFCHFSLFEDPNTDDIISIQSLYNNNPKFLKMLVHSTSTNFLLFIDF